MLKKPILDFFNHDLAGVNPSKSYKLLDFLVSQFGNPSVDCTIRLFFNSLLNFAQKNRAGVPPAPEK